MSLARIGVRAVMAYLYLLVVTRASGKRVVGQATPFDFLVALILGDMIDDALWAEVSMAKFAVGAGSVIFCDALAKLGAFRWMWFFHLVNGRSHTLLRDGREDREALHGEQLSEADLAHLLRLEGIDDWSKVHLALLERGHELSVLLCPEEEPATKADAELVR
jgi:uncharacterized membrane protein YcaP (DUF421 family)